MCQTLEWTVRYVIWTSNKLWHLLAHGYHRRYMMNWFSWYFRVDLFSWCSSMYDVHSLSLVPTFVISREKCKRAEWIVDRYLHGIYGTSLWALLVRLEKASILKHARSTPRNILLFCSVRLYSSLAASGQSVFHASAYQHLSHDDNCHVMKCHVKTDEGRLHGCEM